MKIEIKEYKQSDGDTFYEVEIEELIFGFWNHKYKLTAYVDVGHNFFDFYSYNVAKEAVNDFLIKNGYKPKPEPIKIVKTETIERIEI